MRVSIDKEVKALEERCLSLGHKFVIEHSFKSKFKMKNSFALGVSTLCSCTE